MLDLNDIMKKLDWNNTEKEKIDGIKLAMEIKDIECFIQPINSKYSKNVWECCALILYSKKDEELEVYIEKILEWLQDPQWPGFDIIFKRLILMDSKILIKGYIKTIEKATQKKDMIWLDMLSGLIRNEALYNLLSIKEKKILKKYYKNHWQRTISGNLGVVEFFIDGKSKEDIRKKLIEYVLSNSTNVSFNIKNNTSNIKNIKEKLIKKEKYISNKWLYFYKNNNCWCETVNYFVSGEIYIENIKQYEEIRKMGLYISFYLKDKDSVYDIIKL